MLRILQVVPSLDMGGVERVTLDVAKGIREAWPKVPTFVASSGGVLVDPLETSGAQHFTVPYLGSKNPLRWIRHIKILMDLIRDHKIDIVHARSRAPAWSAYWAAKLTGRSFVTTYHGIYSGRLWPKRFYNNIMTKGDRVIAISRFLYEYLRQSGKVRPHNLRLVYEGIDLKVFDPDAVPAEQVERLRYHWGAGDAKVFLLPGRMVKHKGHAVVLRALQHLKGENIKIIFLAQLTDSSFERELRLWVQTHHLPVQFMAPTCPMPVAYRAADFILAPSIKPETFGRVTAEAGAMKRITLTTHIGATPELCLQDVTGFLTKPGNPLELANVIKQVIGFSAEKCHQMEEAARKHVVKNFDLTRMIDETLLVYEELKIGSK